MFPPAVLAVGLCVVLALPTVAALPGLQAVPAPNLHTPDARPCYVHIDEGPPPILMVGCDELTVFLP